MQIEFAVLIGVAILVAAVPYVHAARHPDSKPLAAYLIFVTVLSVVGAGLFWLALTIAAMLVGAEMLSKPWVAIILIAIIAAPALLIARWAISRPPRQSPPVD
ncbi:MAG: hypothetical protein Tsb0016_02370 [Sphingomonadales bacterium]